MLGAFLKVSELLVTSSADCLDVVSKIDGLYNRAWSNLLYIVGVGGAVVGFLIPLTIQFFRDRDFRAVKKDLSVAETQLKSLKSEMDDTKGVLSQMVELHEKIVEQNDKAEVRLSAKIATVEKDLKEVKEWADKAKKSENKARSSNFFNEALKLYNDKKYKEAIAKLNEAIRLDPEYVVAYYNRGVAKMELEDYAGALSDYNKAIKLGLEHSGAYYNKILALMFLGEKEKAEDDLKVLKTLEHSDHTKNNLPVLELIVDGKFDDAGAMIADMKEKGTEVDDDFEKLLKLLNPPK